MSEVTVAQLEKQLDDTKAIKARREAFERLLRNKDFRTLILEGFCRDEAARFVQESADPCLTVEQRADALAMAQASGHLKRFINLSIQMASTAERNIKDLEETLAEVRAEEGAN